jgi:hypothetical protein
VRVRALFILAALVVCATGAANWISSDAGSGAARAGILNGNAPSATKSGTLSISVNLSWAATPGASGYIIGRSGGAGSLSGNCTGTRTTTSCTDSLVLPLNTYTYTVTPLAGNWTGTTSHGTTITT